MTVSPSQINSKRTLVSVLDETGRMEAASALALVRNLARQVSDIHATGMIHGALDPRQIDLLALGMVWCRLLTGESVGAYLRSPRVKGLVPGKQRPILERLLGARSR